MNKQKRLTMIKPVLTVIDQVHFWRAAKAPLKSLPRSTANSFSLNTLS